MTDAAIAELTPLVGVRAACAAVGRPRATHYRHHRTSPAPPRAPRPRPQPVAQPRALSPAERAEVLDVLHEERFVDLAPGEVYAILLDEGRYLCSESHDVPDPARPRRSPRAPPPGHPPAAREARAGRARRQPVLVVGHHEAGRAGEVDLLLPLRRHRHLQPLRRRLDAGHPRAKRPRRAAARPTPSPSRASTPASSPSTPTAARR